VKRNRLLAIALAGVVGSGAAGWMAGTKVQSSNEAAASAKAPEASAVTAAVKRQALSATIVTRGTAQYGEPSKVNLAAGSGGAELVTRAPEASTDLAEGDAFMETNGHPVFALQGDRPMYRELGPGDSGDDVRQLEEALARLGFDPGPVDGVYDGLSGAAVDRWYAAAGYTAQGPSEVERNELRSAESAVDQARTALASARRQLTDGTKAPTEVELFDAENALRQAQDNLASAKLAAADKNTAAERAVTAKTEAVQAAKDQAITDEEKVRRDVNDKYAALQLARASLNAARAAAGSAKGDGAASVQVAVIQAEQALARAEQDYRDSQAARERQPGESQKAIDEAEQAVADARAAVAPTKAAGESSIRAGEAAVTLAGLRLDTLRVPKTNESLAAAVRDAETALAKAQKTLAETEAATGIKVAASSVVFFPTLPLRIDSVKVKRGDAATGEVMTVSGANLAVEALVTVADAKLLTVGMDVRLEAPDLSLDLAGKITEIAEKPGTDGADAQHVHIVIQPIDPPANFKDAAVKVTIPVKSTAGEVLVVPVAAVSSGADGSARVDVVDADGQHREVQVETGLSAGGLVEVTPLNGELKEGDRVVVGAQ
jgi:peptidoglycan hydrolase-like protein with peptidoglycan-binding domain